MDGLDTLIPLPTWVPVSLPTGGSETVEVRPLTVGQIPGFVRAAGPVLKAFGSGEVDWLTLVAEHGEGLIEAVAIAIGRPRAWVADLTVDALIELATTVLTVNGDFFAQRVGPALSRLTARLTGLPSFSG
jgi:hypothetical protein